MKNWKTTLSGFALAGLNLYANGLSGKQIALSLAFAALGGASKDLDVTGAGSLARRVPDDRPIR